MKEIWKTIPGYPGYEISDHGQVRSYLKSRGRNLGSFISTIPQRILKPCPTYFGHLQVYLRRDGKTYRIFIHRLVLTAFIGPCPPGMEACHNDGKPSNNYPDNLRWDSHINNLRDREKHGTSLVGQKNGLAKLTDSKIIQIRKLASQGYTSKQLEEMFSVHRMHINGIIRRQYWAHI